MADTIHIKLVRSPIGTKIRVRQTLKGLGLGKLGSFAGAQGDARSAGHGASRGASGRRS